MVSTFLVANPFEIDDRDKIRLSNYLAHDLTDSSDDINYYFEG